MEGEAAKKNRLVFAFDDDSSPRLYSQSADHCCCYCFDFDFDDDTLDKLQKVSRNLDATKSMRVR